LEASALTVADPNCKNQKPHEASYTIFKTRDFPLDAVSAQRSQEIHGTVRISDARAHALTVKTKGNEERGALFLERTSLDTE
jgi:hypothetical protein